MKISILPNLNAIEVIRRAGYGQVRDQRASEISYSRRLGDGLYPRFHVYINSQTLNLHLDQKQVSYDGYSAHSGEYDGEIVERESERISGIMAKLQTEKSSDQKPQVEAEKKGLFGRFFGA